MLIICFEVRVFTFSKSNELYKFLFIIFIDINYYVYSHQIQFEGGFQELIIKNK